MAYVRPYRVAETSTTTGTGAVTLAGAVTGYITFAGELANADTATIVIEAVDNAGRPTGQWEICDTTFTAPDTLSRGTLRDSSTGSRIDFAAGAKRVFAINPRDVVDLGSADLIGTLGVADGGTGATDAAGARANLSAAVLGDNGDITSMTGLTGGIATADFVTFDTAAAATVATGRIAWGADNETFIAGLSNAFPLNIGQDVIYLAKNDSGGSLAKGRGVMFAGVVGGSSKLEYTNAVSNGTVSHEYAMGIAAQTVANGDFGYVVEFGTVRGFDTTGANKTVPETWAVGDFLYFDPAYPGELTNVQPQAPAWHSPVAVVTSVNDSNGSVFVRAKTGETLSELHDVRINGSGPASGQVLIYDAPQGRWENNTLTPGTGIAVTNAAGAITITNSAPDQVVSLTGAGTTAVTGTYPNFTITSNDAFTGTVTSVDVSGGTTGLTFSGGPVTTSGTITMAGTLGVANGGTGTATALTAGSVVFAGASGVYSQDNANLFWDDTNNRLGIGTSSPSAKLDTVGSGSVYVRARSTDTTGGAIGYVGAEFAGGSALQMRAGLGYTYLVSTGASDPLLFGTNSAERMRIQPGGNVGIGTSSPGYKLSVSGTAEITAAKEGVFTVTDGATVNLDPNNGSIQTWTLGANRTPDQANWAAGQSITLMVDDGSAFTITWSTLAVEWETDGGTAPTLATSGFTVIVLWKVGTTIYGARVGDA